GPEQCPRKGRGRRRKGRTGTPAGPARGGTLGRLAGRVTAAQQLEPLVEQLLELVEGATLHEHVPVGTRRLYLLGLGHGAVDEQRVGTADLALPQCGDL